LWGVVTRDHWHWSRHYLALFGPMGFRERLRGPHVFDGFRFEQPRYPQLYCRVGFAHW
jgi:hypothetical protein